VTHDDAPPVLEDGAYCVVLDSSGLIANILHPEAFQFCNSTFVNLHICKHPAPSSRQE
jgi:hypothetical protein